MAFSYWNPGHRNWHRRVQAQREEFPENVSASEGPAETNLATVILKSGLPRFNGI